MRTDVAILLERLGKRDFQYQEFADRFADVELWPVFETLIRDPRILTPNAPEVATQAAPAPHAPAAAASAQVDNAQIGNTQIGNTQTGKAQIASAPATAPADLAALFARYGGAPEDTPSDVHALLQKLAQQLEQGKL